MVPAKRRELIPEDAEASTRSEVGHGPGEDIGGEDGNPASKPKAVEQGIGPGGLKRAGRPEQGNGLRGHPGRQGLPVAKVASEEKSGMGPEAVEFSKVSGTHMDGGGQRGAGQEANENLGKAEGPA